jgi:hypothetical protein
MGIHGILVGLGMLRTPAVVNRHGRKQPAWEDALPGAAPEAQGRDARGA